MALEIIEMAADMQTTTPSPAPMPATIMVLLFIHHSEPSLRAKKYLPNSPPMSRDRDVAIGVLMPAANPISENGICSAEVTVWRARPTRKEPTIKTGSKVRILPVAHVPKFISSTGHWKAVQG